jgi:hypothetical protein
VPQLQQKYHKYLRFVSFYSAPDLRIIVRIRLDFFSADVPDSAKERCRSSLHSRPGSVRDDRNPVFVANFTNLPLKVKKAVAFRL